MADSIEQRLARLEERLARLETLMGTGDPSQDVLGKLVARRRGFREGVIPTPPAVEPLIPVMPLQEAPLTGAMPPPLPTPDSTQLFNASSATAMAVEKLDDFTAADWAQAAQTAPSIDVAMSDVPQSPPVTRYMPPVLPTPAQGSFERTVGLKWAGWFGAIVLVIGAGLGIKFAYDQGWFGGLPDVVKLMLMSLAGFGLIAAGEVVLRRVSKLSAVGLYGAGVAVLFLVSYAGYEWYSVYAQQTAFVLMALAAVVGVLVAARADLVSIAVLALLGGHLAPIILRSHSESAVPLLSYLAFLIALALGLCYWQATPKWWTLRTISLSATALWQLVLLSADTNLVPADTRSVLPIFVALYALIYQLELIVTMLRVSRYAQASEQSPEAQPGAGLIFSVLVTAQFMLTVLFAQADATASVRGAWVLGTAAVCAAMGFGLRAMRQQAVQGLSDSLRGQAAALLVLAVPILFDNENVVLGWLALSIAFVLLAWYGRLAISTAAAAITWGLAIGAWVIWSQTTDEIWLTLADVPIAGALVIALLISLVGHGLGLLLPSLLARASVSDVPIEPNVYLLHTASGVVWAAAALLSLPTLPATAALLLYGWAAWAISLRPATRGLAYVSAAAVLVAVVKWALVDLLRDRLTGTASASAAVFNPHMAMGVAVAFSVAVIGWTRRSILAGSLGSNEAQALFRSTLAAFVVLILTLGLSVEISAVVSAAEGSAYAVPHGRQLAWTMLWATAGVTVLLLDRLAFRPVNPAIAQWTVIALLAIAIKYLLIDAVAMRLLHYPADVTLIANMQTLAALVAVGGLLAIAFFWNGAQGHIAAQSLMALILLVVGSLEIDRYAIGRPAETQWITRQAGWSIWWSVFAVAAVIVGFGVRWTVLRIFGLALFGLTLAKVVLVDMSEAKTGWRILSFIGLGILLLGTSVLYGRFGQKVLSEETPQS